MLNASQSTKLNIKYLSHYNTTASIIINSLMSVPNNYINYLINYRIVNEDKRKAFGKCYWFDFYVLNRINFYEL